MFTFIDLFAGIGGIRIAFERAGGRCIFSSEIDQYCKETYAANFHEGTYRDIREYNGSVIPKHDVLLAGFPCQPFSLAGYQKGFADERGDLFYHILKIIKSKKPKIVFLENVKNLQSHDKGKTLQTILKELEDVGYFTHHKVIGSSKLVPQHRERLYIVALKNKTPFEFPIIKDKHPKLRDILEKYVNKKYTLTDGTWKSLQRHKKNHAKKGNGFGYNIANLNGISRTLSARYYKDGAEILIPQRSKNPRKLTPRECARLMGFPESFKIPVSDHQAYKQFGNSVVVPVVTQIARQIVKQCLLTLKN